MTFKRIGVFAVRWRYAVIAAWIAVVAIITLVAPNLSDVASADWGTMLPSEAPFRDANAIYNEAFPGSDTLTGAVIVLKTDNEQGILDQAATTFDEQTNTEAGNFIAELVAWLESDDAPNAITEVISPVSAQQAADMTIDEGNQVAMIPVSLSADSADDYFDEEVATPIHEWIIANQPDDIQVYFTGAQPVISAFTQAAIETLESTLIVTVLLVVLLLLLIYRSPVSPFIPLAAVTLSYLLTRGIVAILAANSLTVAAYADILLVVVIYGAGTDYCLFLISRFREEVADQKTIADAASTTIEKVGETITSSAGTIFVGFTAMIFAEVGLFSASGPTLAIGIVVSLIAGLTFVPAILSILGNRAFWPGIAKHRATGRFYARTSNLVAKYPLIVTVVIIAAMAPLAVVGLSAPLSYSTLTDLPDSVEAKQGYALLEDSLGPGNLSPLTVAVTNANTDTMSSDIARLEAELLALDNVAEVLSLNNPAGQGGDISNILRLDSQLRLIATMLDSALSGADGQQFNLQSGIGMFQGMATYLAHIADQFPAVADDPNLLTLQELFANVLVFTQRMDEVAPAFEGLAQQVEATLDSPYVSINELTALVSAGADMPESAMITQLLDQYLSADGQSYRMNVVLAIDPNSAEALDTVLAIRDILPDYQGDGEAIVTGQPVMMTDLRTVLDSDLYLTIGVVSLGIFIVLLVMLRSVIAPLYLIATVGLSYAFTLGATAIVFRVFFGVEDGLAFIIPIFAFVFLVALGVDYSIFLIGRVKEEVAHRGIRDGVHEAVVATGPIITSAGIILAGTFASMMFGNISALAQLGFAVGLGVLIDTFIVRTMLVPAITILLGRWAWWPGGVPHAKAQPRTETPDSARVHAGA